MTLALHSRYRLHNTCMRVVNGTPSYIGKSHFTVQFRILKRRFWSERLASVNVYLVRAGPSINRLLRTIAACDCQALQFKPITGTSYARKDRVPVHLTLHDPKHSSIPLAWTSTIPSVSTNHKYSRLLYLKPYAVADNLVPEDLLMSNRPPTNEERDIIQQSVAPFNAKLKYLGKEISNLKLNIQVVKAQVNQMKKELKRLCDQEVALLESSAAHRRTLSPFRTLPDDILREICIACIDDENYPSTSDVTSMPLVLARISSRMRTVALTTPVLWVNALIDYRRRYPPYTVGAYEIAIKCAWIAKEWFQRAGEMALNISVKETNDDFIHSRLEDSLETSRPLFDVLLSYSARWQKVEFDFATLSGPTLARIAALKATDVPLLQALSLNLRHDTSAFHRGTLLTIPTLKRLSLYTQKQDVAHFSVNWANLTALRIRGKSWVPENAISSVARILQQIPHIVEFTVDMASIIEIGYVGNIPLPYLRSLSIRESVPHNNPNCPGLLNFIDAPLLDALSLGGRFSMTSLSALFQRSPILKSLVLEYDEKTNAMSFTESLYLCSSLLSLHISISPHTEFLMRNFERNPLSDAFFEAFVSNGERGYLCPQLHTFVFKDAAYASVNAIRKFVVGKRQGHGIAGLSDWIKVEVCVSEYNGEQDAISQMQELYREQRAVGQDFFTWGEDTTRSEWAVDYY